MNRLSKLGKRAGIVTAMLAVLAGLGSGQAAASGAPASAHLFWANWGLPIGHANPDGSPAETPIIDSPGRMLYVAANAQHVYWSNQNGSIGRAKVDGSDVQPSLIPLPSGPGRPAAIALDETYVYWIEDSFPYNEGSMGRAKLDGSEVNRTFITRVGRGSGSRGLAVDGQHIYWANEDGIGRADINGQNTQNAYVPRPGGGSINSVAVDATHLYWAYDHRDATGADVFRAPLSNTSAYELLVFSPTDGPMQVAVDDKHVYFSRYVPDWIGRTELDGANDDLDFLSTGVVNPVGIALAPAAALSSNADLAGLSLDEGALAFSPATSGYELQVGHATTDAHLTATLDDPDATVTVNGNPATSGTAVSVPLAVGPNTLSVLVTAENGTTKTYTVTITRAASDDATLSDLNAAEGALSPDYDPADTSYQLDVDNYVTSAHLTGTLAHDDATLAASAGSLSGNTLTLPLEVGPNEVSFTVTAQDGQTTKTYSVTITRAAAPTLMVDASPAKPGSTKPEFTTNPNVQLKITAPAGTKVEISNDPDFQDARIFDVAADGNYAWTLTGDGEHTVYVRFPDAGLQPPLDARVKLDATAPTITKARFLKRRNGRVWLSVAAVDPVSGVAQIEFASKRNHPRGWRSFLGKTSNRTKQPFIWVRTADGAGNVSAWKKIIIPAQRSR